MPWGQAALRLGCVHNAGRWHASPVRPLRRRRVLLADTCRLKGAHDGELEGEAAREDGVERDADDGAAVGPLVG